MPYGLSAAVSWTGWMGHAGGMEIELGTSLDRFIVEASIGQGGQGSVYRVRHVQLGTHFALKVVHSSDARVLQRLLQEGRAQATLKHPNVVNVTDVIDVHGHPGLIMEYVRGPALNELISQHQLSIPQVDEIVTGVCAALEHAHEQGFIHRDLKPHNILCGIVSDAFVPKVTDFGLVKALRNETPGQRLTATDAMLGTPRYMSPEQVRSTRTVDERADIWAMGVTVYEMLTRRLPFDDDDIIEVFSLAAKGEYTPVRTLRADVPPRMARAIDAALVPDPEERVGTIKRFRSLLSGETDDRFATAADTRGQAIWGGLVALHTRTVPPPVAAPVDGDTFDFDAEEEAEAEAEAQSTGEAEPRPLPARRPSYLLPVAGLAAMAVLALGTVTMSSLAGLLYMQPWAQDAPAEDETVPSDPSPEAPEEATGETPPAEEPSQPPAPPAAPRQSAPSPVPVPVPKPDVGAPTFRVKGDLPSPRSVYLQNDAREYVYDGQTASSGRYRVYMLIDDKPEMVLEVAVDTEDVVLVCDYSSGGCRRQ